MKYVGLINCLFILIINIQLCSLNKQLPVFIGYIYILWHNATVFFSIDIYIYLLPVMYQGL